MSIRKRYLKTLLHSGPFICTKSTIKISSDNFTDGPFSTVATTGKANRSGKKLDERNPWDMMVPSNGKDVISAWVHCWNQNISTIKCLHICTLPECRIHITAHPPCVNCPLTSIRYTCNCTSQLWIEQINWNYLDIVTVHFHVYTAQSYIIDIWHEHT